MAEAMRSLTIDTFTPLVGTAFRARTDTDGVVDLRLVEVRPLGHQPQAPRVEPFALEFVGSADVPLDQRTWRLDHESLGAVEIFLVPIGSDPAEGYRYEAVFN
jgi:hypothetical protein